MESRDSKLIADGRAWRVGGRAQALVGPGLATPLIAWHLKWLVRTKTDISLWPSGLVKPRNDIKLQPNELVSSRTDIKLRPSAFVRTRTNFKLQTVGLVRSYKD